MFAATYPGISFFIPAAFVVLDVLAFIQIWRTASIDVVGRIFWSAVVVFVPVVGAIVWLVLWSIMSMVSGNRAR